MIQIKKNPPPDYLEKNKSSWLKDLKQEPINEPIPKKYRRYYAHPKIKDAIVHECFDKCAYCEAFITGNEFGDIEHVVPISLNREKAYTWTNLVLACEVCNNKKRDYNGEEGDIVHPVFDDPSDHLRFYGYCAFKKSIKGKTTIEKIDLNRAKLLPVRKERIDKIESMIDFYKTLAADSDDKRLYKEQIIVELGPEKPFSYASYWFVKLTCPEIIDESDPNP